MAVLADTTLTEVVLWEDDTDEVGTATTVDGLEVATTVDFLVVVDDALVTAEVAAVVATALFVAYGPSWNQCISWSPLIGTVWPTLIA